MAEHSAELVKDKGISYAEAFKMCGPDWKELKDEQKEKYEQLAKKDKER
jgi:hypothetical protein